MRRAAHVAMQALKAGLKAQDALPGHAGLGAHLPDDQARRHAWRRSRRSGGTVLANACGPCIGQWKRSDVGKDETNTIVSSFNRNFPGRNDGSAATLSFLTSPEIVTALAFAGTLEFDPVHGTHDRAGRQGSSASPRPRARSCPREGFARGEEGYEAPAADGDAVQVVDRAGQRAAPAPRSRSRAGTARTSIDAADPGQDQGQDHDRPHLAGRARGSASAATSTRSATTCSWARVNAFTGEAGQGREPSPARPGRPSPQIARDLQGARASSWVVVGDENYGEGSSREHAAMSPRYLGLRGGHRARASRASTRRT